MLTSTLLVTIFEGSCKMLDLELPGDVAIGDLLPLLVEICRAQKDHPHAWPEADARLYVTGRDAPLPAHKTLIDAGVCSGAVLGLQTQRGYEREPNSLTYQQLGRKSVRPDVSTDGIGITWEPF